ncbi:MAG: leucine-rich repeat domain-containing protein [Bacteroidota bacterium]
MKKYFLYALFLTLTLPAFAQEDTTVADTARTYTSLESALRNPDKVYKLRLTKMKLTEFPKEILQFKNLRSLDLSKNKIKEIPAEIGQLTQLQVLNLSKNHLTQLPQEIGELKFLRVFIANQNEIEGIPYTFGQLDKLEYMDLWSNNLSDFPKELSNMKNLKELDLRNIQLNQKEQDYISSLFPNTKIHFSASCNCGN